MSLIQVAGGCNWKLRSLFDTSAVAVPAALGREAGLEHVCLFEQN